jgi:signal transduction histidine kinase
VEDRVDDRPFSPASRLGDAALAAGFIALDTGLTLAGSSWWPERPGSLAWAMLALQAVVNAGLVARRRAPLAVLAAVTGFSVLVTVLVLVGALGEPAGEIVVWPPMSAVLVAYLPVRYAAIRRPGWILVGILTLVAARPWDPSLIIFTVALLRTAVGPLLALYFTARRSLIAVLRERAERAEREQHLLAAQARADERARIAAEMHDVVTHRLSLMVLSAGALRVRATDEETRQAAEEFRAAGCQALDELRDLVGILRTDPDDDSGRQELTLPDIAALAAESRSVGIPTELVEEGDPTRASPVVGRTAYRIVQEALTNVRKHAPGAEVGVVVHYDSDRVHLTIRNTAPVGVIDVGLAATGSGAGLEGLRNRVELVRGTLDAGPSPDGGFEVTASLPAYVPTAEAVR